MKKCLVCVIRGTNYCSKAKIESHIKLLYTLISVEKYDLYLPFPDSQCYHRRHIFAPRLLYKVIAVGAHGSLRDA